MSYPDFVSAIFGTNQQQVIGQQGYQLQQQAGYAQRQAAGAQNAFSYWAAKGVANAAWMPEPTQWDQDYEEAMREVDEIAPGWKE